MVEPRGGGVLPNLTVNCHPFDFTSTWYLLGTVSYLIMTLRNTSGKFSLPTFGRRNTSGDGPSSPSATRTNGNGYYDDDGYSPGKERDRDRDGTGAGGLDALGKKLAKGIAHQSLLPGLGNRDLRALQE